MVSEYFEETRRFAHNNEEYSIESVAMCDDCVWKSPWSIRFPATRWLVFGHDPKCEFFLECKLCEQRIRYIDVEYVYKGCKAFPNEPVLGQRNAGKCHDCWRGFRDAWVDSKKDTSAEMARLAAEVPLLELSDGSDSAVILFEG